MSSFHEIYILDLHGNYLKKEKSPDGTKDENIFDIKQGVAICFFIKKKGPKDHCKVFHADLWGKRELKFKRLEKLDISSVAWEEVSPKPEFYLFTPTLGKNGDKYHFYTKVTDIFPVHSVGIVTGRDKLTIHRDRERMLEAAEEFASAGEEEARQRFNLGDDSRDWQ
ncbi:MAG: DNA methyltransferase, partial [bacterium]|nr:DNA methyltransferase [bacterium]